MFKRALTLLSLLAIAVMLSGCVSFGQKKAAVATNGIIIKDFAFDYSPIYAQEQIGLSLELQNVGGHNGTVKEITLFGADVVYNCSGDVGDLQWCTNDPITRTPNEDLSPPDPATGFEGETSFYDWTLTAPTAVKSPTPYDFQLRVDYSYKTIFTGTLRLVKEDYLRTLPADQREALIKAGGITASSITGGPLSIIAATGRHFIIRDGEGERTIKFKITNVGSGFPYDKSKTGNGLYKIRISTRIGLSSCDPTVTLSRGKTGVFECKFTPRTDFTNKLDKQIQITLEYEYYIDSATSITVNPVLEY